MLINRKGYITIVYTLCAVAFVAIAITIIKADPVTTSVTVGNSAPSFTAGPAESTASDGTTPTNAGSDVTFNATATDSNSEDYYLAICKTNAITPVNGSAPTCDGGNWCISSSTTSGNQASCSYTTLTGDSESNDWYAFVCDNNASSSNCSSASQGSGGTGSPFKVNHAPTFATISNDGPADPGDDVIWSTNSSTTDGDTDTTADTVKLVVCKTAGISGNDCDGGAGDRWCASSFVANNPSCTYSVPTPNAAGSNDAYVYLVDSHDFAATGGNQGSNSSFTVSNVAPVVSGVTLNGGSDITLTEGTTTSITIAGTITDNNSCQDISSVVTSLYRSSVSFASCDTVGESDDNFCYADVSCSVVGSGNTCTGASDASADYECSISVQYFADPTDTNTEYPTDTWLTTIDATDGSLSDNTEVSAGVEMNSLVGYDVTGSIAYGNLDVGEKNDPLDKTTTITATGNVGLDEELSGTDMDDGGVNTIGVAYQKHALATATAYASGTSLSGSATEYELNCQKTTASGSPQTKNTWWGLEIPAGTVPGSYSGTNTVTAVKGETADW